MTRKKTHTQQLEKGRLLVVHGLPSLAPKENRSQAINEIHNGMAITVKEIRPLV